MNINTKVKVNTMAYICANTIDVAIGKGFVEVSRNDSKFALVVFDGDISNKSILIGSGATKVDLPNFTITSQINDTPILHLVDNSLLHTAHACWFVLDVHDAVERHGEKYVFIMDYDSPQLNFTIIWCMYLS